MIHWLFDKVPDISGYVKGTKVTLNFWNQTESRKSAILSKMPPPARENEEIVAKEALNNLESGIIFHYEIALDRETRKKLAGGGSLCCHTLRLCS